MFIIELVHP